MARIAVLLMLLLTLPICAQAMEASLAKDLRVGMELAEGWEFSREPPAFLLEETAEHISHELRARNRDVGPEKAREFARKRLAANEAFVFDSRSGACLLIDFSALREGENPPAPEALARSARLAGEGLDQEEGIDGVEFRTDAFSVTGADSAYRLDAEFRMHGEPRKFIGLVGFASPYWFYLYYTDTLKDPSNFDEMEKILRSIRIDADR